MNLVTPTGHCFLSQSLPARYRTVTTVPVTANSARKPCVNASVRLYGQSTGGKELGNSRRWYAFQLLRKLTLNAWHGQGRRLLDEALVLAGLADSARPPERLSVSQSGALAVTGLVWSRYSLVIVPKNWSLFGVNLLVGTIGIVQLLRIANVGSIDFIVTTVWPCSRTHVIGRLRRRLLLRAGIQPGVSTVDYNNLLFGLGSWHRWWWWRRLVFFLFQRMTQSGLPLTIGRLDFGARQQGGLHDLLNLGYTPLDNGLLLVVHAAALQLDLLLLLTFTCRQSYSVRLQVQRSNRPFIDQWFSSVVARDCDRQPKKEWLTCASTIFVIRLDTPHKAREEMNSYCNGTPSWQCLPDVCSLFQIKLILLNKKRL
ncbi:hypothetical protein M514_05908 [Trichuris suis]|uniref:Mitochondrial pyruvate carrier n=1 Tax=Trichuris suis TaxID=68888 RepID=A0A085M7K2_9BILA|nr:hypothetical protein M513_05908 [Trichuris suis]KFD60786.1 hypothetical protein M514_05908 [Trichuris suis]